MRCFNSINHNFYLIFWLIFAQIIDGRPRGGHIVEAMPNGTACTNNLDCASGCCLIRLANLFWDPLPMRTGGTCVAEAMPGQVCGLMSLPKKGKWGRWGIPGTYQRDYSKDFFPDTKWRTPNRNNWRPPPGGFPNNNNNNNNNNRMNNDYNNDMSMNNYYNGVGTGMGGNGMGKGMGMGWNS